jgi:hypothetical protein
MDNSKFLRSLRQAYQQILFEQQMPPGPAGAEPLGGAPLPTSPGAEPGVVPPPLAGTEKPSELANQEQGDTPLSMEEESFLANLLAKAVFIDIQDEEKSNLINLQKNLSNETSNQIENEVIKMLNAEGYQMIDVDENLFDISPRHSRNLIEYLKSIIGNEELKSGKGRVYITNLLITTLLRDFSVGEKGEVIEALERFQKKDDTSTVKESRTHALLRQIFEKYK